jgi:hypothetical protein
MRRLTTTAHGPPSPSSDEEHEEDHQEEHEEAHGLLSFRLLTYRAPTYGLGAAGPAGMDLAMWARSMDRDQGSGPTGLGRSEGPPQHTRVQRLLGPCVVHGTRRVTLSGALPGSGATRTIGGATLLRGSPRRRVHNAGNLVSAAPNGEAALSDVVYGPRDTTRTLTCRAGLGWLGSDALDPGSAVVPQVDARRVPWRLPKARCRSSLVET